jgi:hypothetical protein
MWKKLGIGAAALAVFGLSSVLAQRAPDPQGGPPPFSREDAGAFLEARIAALHAGLQLTPAQEPLWPPFEQAYRDRGKLRLARAAGPPPAADDPISRLQRRADALLQQGAVLKRLADAATPLWQSFDDGQKRRFAVLARPFYQRMMTGFGSGRPDERSGPGRDGGRFGLDDGQRGFGPRSFGPPVGPGGPFGRDGDDRGPRSMGPGPSPGIGPGAGPGIGPGIGPRMRSGGPPGRDGEEFGYGRAPRGPDGGFGREQRRDSGREQGRDQGREQRRDSGRDQGRDYGRGQFRWWRGPADGGPGRQGRADGEEQL